MKAVNLIPEDLRRGSSAAGRSGPAPYILLGVLGALVVLVSAWALAGRQVTDRQNELARVQVEAQTAEARAGALQAYTKFAALRDKRVQTVTTLSRTRFNWPYALREVSRVVPANVWLTGLTGTVAPDVPLEGAAGGSGGLRGALKVPAIELTGCTTSQREVAKYLARLRSIDGVTRVSLGASEKAQSAAGASTSAPAAGPSGGSAGGSAGGADSADSGGDCRQTSDQAPKFEAVVFFERSTAAATGAESGAAATPPPPTNGTTPSSSTPASSSAPASGAPSSSTPTSGTAPSTGSTK